MYYSTYTCWCNNNCNEQVLSPSCPIFNGGIKSLLEKLLNIPQKHTITGIMWASITLLKPHIALLLQEYNNRTGWTMFLMFLPQTLKKSKNYNWWYPTPWCQDLELCVDTSWKMLLSLSKLHTQSSLAGWQNLLCQYPHAWQYCSRRSLFRCLSPKRFSTVRINTSGATFTPIYAVYTE